MIYVFIGPTLSAEEARRELDAVFLPPAAQGDVYRAALERPEALGLVDGYFDSVPSVWHKEILWAMSQGIHVFGSASMGALRAAELAPFGMRGVGAIFEAFQSGELDDDDAVAVVHAPAEQGFRALSEALVNIRATLASAEREGLLAAAEREALERLARELYYPDRSYPTLLTRAGREGLLTPEALQRLRAWLPRGRVDQKRADALAMLRGLREHQAARPGPKKVSYVFAHTDAWESACQSAGRLEDEGTAGDSPSEESLLEEVRVSGLFARVYPGALARALALEEAHRQGHEVDAKGLREAYEAFCRERGLREPGQREQWMAEQQLDAPERFFQDEARVRRIQLLLASEVARVLPDHLRTLGTYGALRERASRKARVLGQAGLEQPGLAEAGLTEEALWSWYFPERLGRPIPSHLERYALDEGFTGTEALRRAVLREYCASRFEPSFSHEEQPAETP